MEYEEALKQVLATKVGPVRMKVCIGNSTFILPYADALAFMKIMENAEELCCEWSVPEVKTLNSGTLSAQPLSNLDYCHYKMAELMGLDIRQIELKHKEINLSPT